MNEQFIRELYRAAVKAERETGIPAIFSTAQAILEAGWDVRPITGSNNIYGIKYHISKWGYVEALTTEFEDGIEYHKTLKFQKYPTLADCINDHNKLLLSDIKGSNAKFTYRQCLENYKRTKNYGQYVRCVAKSYATDPHYADKIIQIGEVLYEMGITAVASNDYKDEFEKAKKEMVEKGIFKPYGNENVYWETHLTREELAAVLYRFERALKITLGGEK